MDYSKLCSTCQRALRPDWEGERRHVRPHHKSLQSFLQAVSENCFICWRTHKRILTTYDATKGDRPPAWINGVEADWGIMNSLVRHDPNTPAILILITCHDSNEHSYWVPFYLMATNDNHWARNTARPQLQPHTSSRSTLELISKWIRECQTSHPACQWREEATPWQPTRLLDLGRLDDKMWKLVLLSRRPKKAHTYITLSYRWGSEDQPRLLTRNINALCQGSTIAELPKTFRDAIVVARALGVRYLWIDALCIIQDSHEDWERESASMGSVYANALCNIAASASDGPDGGLFRQRDPGNLRLGYVRAAPLPDTQLQTYHLIDGVYSDRQIRHGPLSRRGWVFQERMLAASVVYFAEDQVFWECCSAHSCEAFPAGIPFAKTSKDQLPRLLKGLVSATAELSERQSRSVFTEWNLVVQRYSECEFSQASDKLPALMGISIYFGAFVRDDFVYGMWRSRVIDQLGYVVENPAMKRSTAYRAPSWPWASLDGPIVSPHLIEEHFTHISVKVDDLHLGQLRLRGVLTRATYSHPTRSRRAHIVLESGKALDIIFLRDHLGVELDRGISIMLLAFQSQLVRGPYLGCFVLEPVLCAFPAITYRRIGFAHFFQSELLNPAVLEADMYVALGVVFEDGISRVKSSRLEDVVIV